MLTVEIVDKARVICNASQSAKWSYMMRQRCLAYRIVDGSCVWTFPAILLAFNCKGKENGMSYKKYQNAGREKKKMLLWTKVNPSGNSRWMKNWRKTRQKGLKGWTKTYDYPFGLCDSYLKAFKCYLRNRIIPHKNPNCSHRYTKQLGFFFFFWGMDYTVMEGLLP